MEKKSGGRRDGECWVGAREASLSWLLNRVLGKGDPAPVNTV